MPDEVEKLVLGDPADENDFGLLHKMKKGSYLIVHTSCPPRLAQTIDIKAGELGINSIDAPVSGGDHGARGGNLVTMAGGDMDPVDHVLPIMKSYSKECHMMGRTTAGQHTKAANQIMFAGTIIGLCESLVYGFKAGLKLEEVIKLLSGGAANSYSLKKHGPKML